MKDRSRMTFDAPHAIDSDDAITDELASNTTPHPLDMPKKHGLKPVLILALVGTLLLALCVATIVLHNVKKTPRPMTITGSLILYSADNH